MRGGSKREEKRARDEALKGPTVEIIREHPAYGYRRIKPELERIVGEIVNHKRIRRLLNAWDLSLQRTVSRPKPSPIRRILSEARGHSNLVRALEPGPLEVLSTDFTELRYRGGARKAWLIALMDTNSAWTAGWAVGPSANRAVALRAKRRAREGFSRLGEELAGTIVHQDQDAVFTSYAWLRALLLEAGARVSYSENGAKGNPWTQILLGPLQAGESLAAPGERDAGRAPGCRRPTDALSQPRAAPLRHRLRHPARLSRIGGDRRLSVAESCTSDGSNLRVHIPLRDRRCDRMTFAPAGRGGV